LVTKPPNLTEIATAVGRIKLLGAALAEKLPVSHFARVITAAVITVRSMGTDDA
jgi:hypothetical protein